MRESLARLQFGRDYLGLSNSKSPDFIGRAV
jgi:hypothetical protein